MVTRGKVHNLLSMKLDYQVKGQVTVDMVKYVDKMTNAFKIEEIPSNKVASPWTDNLFIVQEDSPLLSEEQRKRLHTLT